MHNDRSDRELRQRARHQQNRAALPTREADDATSLEVDLMMLDYMAHNAIEHCLMQPDSTQPQPHETSQLASSLQIIDDLLNLLSSRDPRWTPDPELRFRLLLLKFVVLFTKRHQRCGGPGRQGLGVGEYLNGSHASDVSNGATFFSSASLRTLRAENTARARRWIGTLDRVPTATYDFSMYEEPASLPIPSQDAKRWKKVFWGVDVGQDDDLDEDEAIAMNNDNPAYPRYLTLLDLLPAFMHLSAACHALHDRVVSERWMQLVNGLARAACLEQYLACGASGTDALDEAFAWGCMRDEDYVEQVAYVDGLSHHETLDRRRTCEIESMFRAVLSDNSSMDGAGPDTDEWLRLRAIALAQLCPTPALSGPFLYKHLADLAETYPPAQDSADLRQFLIDVADCVPKPVLVQLEGGQLDGMTGAQTKEFLENCGVREGELF